MQDSKTPRNAELALEFYEHLLDETKSPLLKSIGNQKRKSCAPIVQFCGSLTWLIVAFEIVKC